jgi:hypothetical protein
VIAVAVLIALVLWLVVQWRSSVSKPAASAPQRAGAVPVTQAVLGALARSSPIYWAGARAGTTYELTRTADGRIFLRYLPHGVAVGAVEPYLTIGTYPLAGAFAITNTLAARNGAVRVNVPGGGVGFYDASSPTNVYVAFPRAGDQIEVYDPAAGEALRLVASGQIGPVSTAAAATAPVASAASFQQLRMLSAALGHPLYWAGPRAAGRYELTRTPGGHVFVRYLPTGAAVGTSNPYLTIGTYPINGAFALTKRLSTDPTAVRVAVGHGGVAFFTRTRPTNVYVAYPGTNTQIEVYDPAPGAAQRLVGSNRIVPVG